MRHIEICLASVGCEDFKAMRYPNPRFLVWDATAKNIKHSTVATLSLRVVILVIANFKEACKGCWGLPQQPQLNFRA